MRSTKPRLPGQKNQPPPLVYPPTAMQAVCVNDRNAVRAMIRFIPFSSFRPEFSSKAIPSNRRHSKETRERRKRFQIVR